MKTKLYCEVCDLEFTVNAKNINTPVKFCPFCGTHDEESFDFLNDDDEDEDDYNPEEELEDEY